MLPEFFPAWLSLLKLAGISPCDFAVLALDDRRKGGRGGYLNTHWLWGDSLRNLAATVTVTVG